MSHRTSYAANSVQSNLANAPGTEAALPASAPAGATYFATDTGVLFQYSGTAWVPVSWQGRVQSGVTGTDAAFASSDLTIATTVIVSGTENCVGIFLPKGRVYTTLKWKCGGTLLTQGSNNDAHQYLVVRDSSGNLMCSTADRGTAALAAQQFLSLAIARDSANAAAASWTVPSSAMYLLGVMIYMGTGGSPVICTSNGKTGISANTVNNNLLTAMTGATGNTSGIPATTCSPANGTVQPWLGIS